MSRKALFFDIDGTLLDDETKKMPESAVDVIRKAREAGHLVVINSGRARCLMREIEEALPVDGYLCGCGTYIEVQGRVLLHHRIGKDRRWRLQQNILDYNLEGILEGCEGCYAHSAPTRMEEVERVKEVVRRSDMLFEADWRETVLPFDKFCALADEKSDRGGFIRSMEPDLAVIDRGHGLYECVPKGFDKATCMRFILEYFSIPWEESYAFGDSTNDLAMIRYAHNAVVMGRHSRELEPYASMITKDVSDDGIAYAFEKLHII